jgi:hypothetical protein
MTERYGSGHGDEGGQRPSGRGAVTERLARHDHGAREIDLTDEAARGEDGADTAASPAARPDGDPEDRESSGAFEPAAPTADPPAESTRPGATSIFDVDERASHEDLERTGYEPPVSDADPAEPRGETVVTGPGERRDEPGATDPGEPRLDEPGPPDPDDGRPDESAEITPTPVPVADPSGTAAPVEGLPEPPRAAASTAGADPTAEGQAGAPGSLLGSLDAGEIRNRFLDLQAGFVDEPRQAVEEAGRLVDDLVGQVVDALQGQRGQLAGTTGEGSTEDLRLALRAYRQFIDRLLGLAD